MRPLASLLALIVILAALYFIALSRGPDILAGYLSKELGVSVSIDSVKPRWDTFRVEMFDVANESGYTLPKAFSAKTIELKAPASTYFSDPVVVEQITVDTIYLGIEFDSTTSASGNWTKLMSHYQDKADLAAKDGKKVLIKKMIFTNIQADLIFHNQGGKIQKLPLIPRIELTNISTEGGFPINQLTSSILGQLIKQAFMQYHIDSMLLQVPGKAVELFMKPFEGVFNAAPNQKEYFKEIV